MRRLQNLIRVLLSLTTRRLYVALFFFPELAGSDADQVVCSARSNGRKYVSFTYLLICKIRYWRIFKNYDPHAYLLQNFDVAYSYRSRGALGHFRRHGKSEFPTRFAQVDSRDIPNILNAWQSRWFQIKPGWGDSPPSGAEQDPEEVWQCVKVDIARLAVRNPVGLISETFYYSNVSPPSFDEILAILERLLNRVWSLIDLENHVAAALASDEIHRRVQTTAAAWWRSKGSQPNLDSSIRIGAGFVPELRDQCVKAGWFGPNQTLTADREFRLASQEWRCNGLTALSQGNGGSIGVIVSLFRSDAFIERFVDQLQSLDFEDGDRVWIGACQSSPLEEKALGKLSSSVFKINVFPVRLGIYEVWNKGVLNLDTTYLTNMNCDDVRPPWSLKAQHSAAAQFPNTDILYGGFIRTSPGLHAGFGSRSAWLERPQIGTFNVFMNRANPPHNAPLWKRSLHDELGLFTVQQKSAGDNEFWIRCLLAGRSFVAVPQYWSEYFENPDGLSTSPQTPGAVEQARSIAGALRDLPEPLLCALRDAQMGRHSGSATREIIARIYPEAGVG